MKVWGCAVAWVCTQQTVVAASTTLAEIIAACKETMETELVRMLMDKLEVRPAVADKIFMDNMAAIHAVWGGRAWRASPWM